MLLCNFSTVVVWENFGRLNIGEWANLNQLEGKILANELHVNIDKIDSITRIIKNLTS